jgi:hypothetical protein
MIGMEIGTEKNNRESSRASPLDTLGSSAKNKLTKAMITNKGKAST